MVGKSIFPIYDGIWFVVCVYLLFRSVQIETDRADFISLFKHSFRINGNQIYILEINSIERHLISNRTQTSANTKQSVCIGTLSGGEVVPRQAVCVYDASNTHRKASSLLELNVYNKQQRSEFHVAWVRFLNGAFYVYIGFF